MSNEFAYITLNVDPNWSKETTTKAIRMLIEEDWIMDVELVNKMPLEVVFYRAIL